MSGAKYHHSSTNYFTLLPVLPPLFLCPLFSVSTPPDPPFSFYKPFQCISIRCHKLCKIWTFNFLRAVDYIFLSRNIILELVNKTAHIYQDRSYILCSLTEIWSFFPFFSFFVCLFNLFSKPAKKIIAWEWVRRSYIVCFSKAHDVLVSTGPLLKNTAFLDMFNKSIQSNSCCIFLHLTLRKSEQRDVLI